MTESILKFEMPKPGKPVIRVIGVGGGGSNAVNNMYNIGIKDVDFIVCDTDKQALYSSPVSNKLQIGINLTEGMGTGNNPEKGKKAALENKENIREILNEDTKMVFITAGMGGGTGTGAAPIIAEFTNQLDILTIGIVTMPCKFEGNIKMKTAQKGLEALKKYCDTVLIILNQNLMETLGNLNFTEAFSNKAYDVLTTAVKSIVEIITVTGDVNVDFEDIKTIMKNSGDAVIGSAIADGEDRGEIALEKAINSPLLNNQNIQGAKKILLSITCGDKAEFKVDELNKITDLICNKIDKDKDIDLIYGYSKNSELGESIQVTIIATGFKKQNELQNEDPIKEEDMQMEFDESKQTVFDLASLKKIKKEKNNDKKEQFNISEPRKTNPPIPFEIEYPDNMDLKESEEELLFIDSDLEELNDMAHPPSRKIILKEQAEMRRKKLKGIKNNNDLDTKEFQELLNTPAFLRRKVKLENVPLASNRLVSKFNLNDDNELYKENKYFHDNVD